MLIWGFVALVVLGGLYLAFGKKSGSDTPRVDLPANTKPSRPDH